MATRTNSKNLTEDFIYWRLDLLFTLAPSMLYIIKRSSNLGFIRGRFRNPATFQTKFHMTKKMGFEQLPVVWKSSTVDMIVFLYYVQSCSSPINIPNIFAFDKMNHFSLVFKWYIENYLNLKASLFRKANISWYQQKTMRTVKCYAQLKD